MFSRPRGGDLPVARLPFRPIGCATGPPRRSVAVPTRPGCCSSRGSYHPAASGGAAPRRRCSRSDSARGSCSAAVVRSPGHLESLSCHFGVYRPGGARDLRGGTAYGACVAFVDLDFPSEGEERSVPPHRRRSAISVGSQGRRRWSCILLGSRSVSSPMSVGLRSWRPRRPRRSPSPRLFHRSRSVGARGCCCAAGARCGRLTTGGSTSA